MRKEYRSAQKERYRTVIRDAKSVPCADCGIQYPHYVMDFDHRPEEEKLFNIGMMVSYRPAMQVFLDEIAKCDVVCANCHRERTFQRSLNIRLGAV
jgi:hypothetical protein